MQNTVSHHSIHCAFQPFAGDISDDQPDFIFPLSFQVVKEIREESFVPEPYFKLQQFKTNLEQMLASFQSELVNLLTKLFGRFCIVQ